MLHEIDSDEVSRGQEMTDAIQACVHCGFCLPTCPTYQVLGQEMDSPRGRIFLMKEVLEGKLDPQEAQPHIDRCLGCLACETNCPSGVKYGELLSPYRALQQAKSDSTAVRLRRWLASNTLPYPSRFRLALRVGAIGKSLSWLTPSALKPMTDMLPDELPDQQPLPELTPAKGERRGRVALLAGCAQQVLQPDINLSAIRVLSQNGIEVIVPRGQGCCGALAWHVGDANRAAKAARKNLKAFPDDIDAIVTTAAGCGSGLNDYPLILSGTENEEAAKSFAERTVDVSRYLVEVGFKPPSALEQPIRIAYHDACHLAHAQRVRAEPRQLLRKIAGVELVEIRDPEICCGSAGTYNIDQPEIAAELGRRKAEGVLETDCEFVALGNIGCLVQIDKYLREQKSKITVLHTVQILDRAYRNSLA